MTLEDEKPEPPTEEVPNSPPEEAPPFETVSVAKEEGSNDK
jgi:hypothetical protein